MNGKYNQRQLILKVIYFIIFLKIFLSVHLYKVKYHQNLFDTIYLKNDYYQIIFHKVNKSCLKYLKNSTLLKCEAIEIILLYKFPFKFRK